MRISPFLSFVAVLSLLIRFQKESRKNVQKAMDTAENYSIPCLLDANDFLNTPDTMSNFLYLCYFRMIARMSLLILL